MFKFFLLMFVFGLWCFDLYCSFWKHFQQNVENNCLCFDSYLILRDQNCLHCFGKTSN